MCDTNRNYGFPWKIFLIFFQVKRICMWNRAENSFSKLVFFVMCEIELKPSESFCVKTKKTFLSENLFSMNKTNRTFVFPRVKPPTQKNVILRRTFFFSSKKNLCSAEKAFYVWNRNKTFFSTVKPRESMFWTCETKKPFFQEKNVLFFLMCYNFFSMCETKRNYVFPLVKAKTFFFFFFLLLWNKVKTFFQERNFFFFTVLNQHYYHVSFMSEPERNHVSLSSKMISNSHSDNNHHTVNVWENMEFASLSTFQVR